jgi:hypothetical protein
VKADPNTGQVSTADGTPIAGATISGPDKTFKNAQQNPIAGANIKDNKLVDYTGNPVNLKSLGMEGNTAQANSSAAPATTAGTANSPPTTSQASNAEGAPADRGNSHLSSGKVAAIVIGCVAAALMLACCVFGAMRWKRKQEADEYQVSNTLCKFVLNRLPYHIISSQKKTLCWQLEYTVRHALARMVVNYFHDNCAVVCFVQR